MADFICFDTEDNSAELMAAGKSGFEKKITQIAALTDEGESYYSKGRVEHFLKWLQQRPERFVYAHNIQYDAGNLFGLDLENFDFTLVDSRFIRGLWGKKVFSDSMNIWPMALAKVGKAFGIKKLETVSMAHDKEYVFRDVEIIRAAMAFAWQFCDLLGLRHLSPTLGGLAVKIWKAWGGVNHSEAIPDLRQALYGGHVELFKVHNEESPVSNCDINSLYPAMMRNSYPGPLEADRGLGKEFGIAECEVQVPEMELCPLPWRDPRNGKILFPWGKFRGWWTYHELRELKRAGGKVLGVIHSFGANESVRPYAEFVDRLYAIRKKTTNDAESLFFKLLLNNLFGRLGSTGKIARTVWKLETDGVMHKRLVSYHMPLAREVNWTHCTYVTSYGRLELLKHLRQVGAKRLIYCDTDSVIFDGASLPFKVGNGLGEMKLVSRERDCVTFAPKMYKLGKQYKAKGIPYHSRTDANLQRTFIRTGEASFELPFKLREAIAFYYRGNVKRASVWRKITKHMITNYDKKILLGNRYYPCNVSSYVACSK